MELLAIGTLDDFQKGWAIIPFNRSPHYWRPDRSRMDYINEHGRHQHWVSVCGRASAVTNDRLRPLVTGNYTLCRLCKRAKGAR